MFTIHSQNADTSDEYALERVLEHILVSGANAIHSVIEQTPDGTVIFERLLSNQVCVIADRRD